MWKHRLKTLYDLMFTKLIVDNTRERSSVWELESDLGCIDPIGTKWLASPRASTRLPHASRPTPDVDT